jgi:hypothetical protein
MHQSSIGLQEQARQIKKDKETGGVNGTGVGNTNGWVYVGAL